MPFNKLAEHEEREHLMCIAFTCFEGQNEGEFELQCNPVYKKQIEDKRKLLN